MWFTIFSMVWMMKWWVEECVGSFCGVRFVWNIFSSYCCQWSDSEPDQSHTDTHRSSDHDAVLILTTAECHPVWGGAAMRLSSDENTGNSLELVLLPTLFEGSGPWSLSVSGRVRVPSLRSPLHTNILYSASIICEPVTAAHTLLLPPHIVTSMTCDQWDTCGTCHGADETARSGASSTVS